MAKKIQVKFGAYYKNGLIGIEAAEGEIVEMTEAEYQQVWADVRNPDSQLEVVKGKAAPPPEPEPEPEPDGEG